MTTEEIRTLIDTDPDFVAVKRFDFSLEKLLDRYPDGAPIRLIAQALMMSETEAEELSQKVIQKLRTAMKVEV